MQQSKKLSYNRRFSLLQNFLWFFLIMNALPAVSQTQDLKFVRLLSGGSDIDFVLSIAQDKYGFIWLSRQLSGLQRYDGNEFISYQHNPENPNSPASNHIEAFIIDRDNIFWLGTIDKGLDRFDPIAHTFIHYRHSEKDNSSIVSDKINILFEDSEKNIWIGTDSGLDMLDKKTGRFAHYKYDPLNKKSLSNNVVRAIYEDRKGTLWVGCGWPISDEEPTDGDGGLNQFHRNTGTFTRYLHDPNNPSSIADNRVRAIYEDSKGNFWVGTRGDGLHIMDRSRGSFHHFYYDPSHPKKLSRPPQQFTNGISLDHISFITEDATGKIVIGTFLQGINYFNPTDSTVKHYGFIYTGDEQILNADTSTGLKTAELFKIFNSREGAMFIGTLSGDLYMAKPFENNFPYYSLNKKMPDANSLYNEPNGNILWVGTDQGLFQKNIQTGTIRTWVHDSENPQSICNDTVTSIKPDDAGRLWLATKNGLTRFDPSLNTFKVWKNDKNNPKSLHSNNLNYIFIDRDKTVWIGSVDAGIDKMDSTTETFTNFNNEPNNPKTLSNNYVFQICEDKNGYIWIATDYGLDKIKKSNGTIFHYLPDQSVRTVLTDKKGVVWAASVFTTVFRYDSTANNFQPFQEPNFKKEINKVINIIEDKQENLWFTQARAIVRLDAKRENIRIYDKGSGIHSNNFGNADNYVNTKGEIFLGDQDGYYHIFPAKFAEAYRRPSVILTNFMIDNIDVKPGKQQPLLQPIYDAQLVTLKYNQNNFLFDFVGINYLLPGAIKYLFKLENYDADWHDIGTEHKAYFYNVPPGNYILYVKALSEDGSVGNRKIDIIITPPWWRTWWAYIIFALSFIGIVWGFIYYRSRALRRENRVLEEKVAQRTAQLNQSLENLKSTQSQLIQSEKMASLGELTAGIAHEIQNPLNFVNNFSEVNKEWLMNCRRN